jgi:hypothetical protein
MLQLHAVVGNGVVLLAAVVQLGVFIGIVLAQWRLALTVPCLHAVPDSERCPEHHGPSHFVLSFDSLLLTVRKAQDGVLELFGQGSVRRCRRWKRGGL